MTCLHLLQLIKHILPQTASGNLVTCSNNLPNFSCNSQWMCWLPFAFKMLQGSWDLLSNFDILWSVKITELLSHPVLWWLYVFSPFPPRPRPCPRRRPLPQKLFPLTSKPFELNLWYLAQRIYGSGELYWMTFPWPWPKVTAVASISQNELVCKIKWEPLIGSLQNVTALLP